MEAQTPVKRAAANSIRRLWGQQDVCHSSIYLIELHCVVVMLC